MSADAYDPREAPSVLCLASSSLVSPPQAIKEGIPDDETDLDWFNRPRKPNEPDPNWFDQLVLRSLGEEVSQTWKTLEIHLEDGRILVLEYT